MYKVMYDDGPHYFGALPGEYDTKEEAEEVASSIEEWCWRTGVWEASAYCYVFQMARSMEEV